VVEVTRARCRWQIDVDAVLFVVSMCAVGALVAVVFWKVAL